MPEKWLLLLRVCSEHIHSRKVPPVSVGLGLSDPSPADYLPPGIGRSDVGLFPAKESTGCLDGTTKKGDVWQAQGTATWVRNG